MLKSLLRVRFAELFRGGTRGRSGSRKKSGAGKIVLFALLMLYVAASVFLMMFGTFFSMMPTLAAANAQWLVFAVAAIASCGLSLLLDTPMAQAQLYEAHDNEMLLSLPIPPRTILFSRMLSMYLFSLLYAAVFYIPAFAVCAMYMPVTFPGVVCFVLSMLFGQLVPLALSCLLGRFFAFLKRRFQKAQILTAVLLGLLMQLAAGVFLILRGKAFLAKFEGLIDGDMLCALGTVALCLILCTDVISGASVSMERNNIWIVQSLPVSSSKVLFAKALSHFFICAPFSLVSSVLFAIALSANAVQTAFLILLPLLMTAFCALFGVRMNLLFPRLDFVSDVAVVKRSGSVICTMFGTWALVGLCVTAYLFFGARVMSVNAALCCFALVLILGCAVCAAYLNGRGAKKFSRLG